MKTIEAIRFVNYHIRGGYYMGVPERMKADDINRLLRRGKKYEQIYKDLEEEYKKLPFSVASGILLRMRQLKQKYFPKPKKEVIK